MADEQSVSLAEQWMRILYGDKKPEEISLFTADKDSIKPLEDDEETKKSEKAFNAARNSTLFERGADGIIRRIEIGENGNPIKSPLLPPKREAIGEGNLFVRSVRRIANFFTGAFAEEVRAQKAYDREKKLYDKVMAGFAMMDKRTNDSSKPEIKDNKPTESVEEPELVRTEVKTEVVKEEKIPEKAPEVSAEEQPNLKEENKLSLEELYEHNLVQMIQKLKDNKDPLDWSKAADQLDKNLEAPEDGQEPLKLSDLSNEELKNAMKMVSSGALAQSELSNQQISAAKMNSHILKELGSDNRPEAGKELGKSMQKLVGAVDSIAQTKIKSDESNQKKQNGENLTKDDLSWIGAGMMFQALLKEKDVLLARGESPLAMKLVNNEFTPQRMQQEAQNTNWFRSANGRSPESENVLKGEAESRMKLFNSELASEAANTKKTVKKEVAEIKRANSFSMKKTSKI